MFFLNPTPSQVTLVAYTKTNSLANVLLRNKVHDVK